MNTSLTCSASFCLAFPETAEPLITRSVRSVAWEGRSERDVPIPIDDNHGRIARSLNSPGMFVVECGCMRTETGFEPSVSDTPDIGDQTPLRFS